MPAPKVESVATALVATNTPSITIPKPAGTVQGDLLVGYVGGGAVGQNITPPGGWTEPIPETDHGSGTITLQLAYLIAGPSEPASYVWTNSPNHPKAGAILRISGYDAAEIVHKLGILTGSSPVTTTPDELTTKPSLIFKGSCFAAGVVNPGTSPPGYTEQFDIISTTGSSGGIGATLEQSAPGATGPVGFIMLLSRDWVSWTWAIGGTGAGSGGQGGAGIVLGAEGKPMQKNAPLVKSATQIAREKAKALKLPIRNKFEPRKK